MLMRFDPFREFDRLTDQLWGRTATSMPMDAYRDEAHVVAQFDVPGIAPDSIQVTVEHNVLTVSAARERHLDEGVDLLVAERPYGRVSRQLFLGDNLDTEHIEASYDSGVLTVRVPVAEQAKPRRVAITSGSTANAIEATSAAA
jgi:HSP20 family protein